MGEKFDYRGRVLTGFSVGVLVKRVQPFAQSRSAHSLTQSKQRLLVALSAAMSDAYVGSSAKRSA